jgi:hypothetical protein
MRQESGNRRWKCKSGGRSEEKKSKSQKAVAKSQEKGNCCEEA